MDDILAPHEFCPVCQRIISNSKVLSGGKGIKIFDHYQSFAALTDSADNGCHLCSLLLSTLPTKIPPGSVFHSEDLRYRIIGPDSCLRIKILDRLDAKLRRIGLDKIQVPGLRITPSSLHLDDIEDSLPVEGDMQQLLRKSENKAKLSLFTGSDATFELAKTWIRYCISNHYACKKAGISVSALPTRLLDLKTTSKEDDIQLCLTTDLLSHTNAKRIKYVALSHRWGTSTTLRLLQGPKGTMERFTTSISLNALPLTFRHAVVITRRLGYRYLWIDSLCIIQNSESDWTAESTIMGGIYRGSVCTIAALGAKDSHGGCFTSRNPLKSLPCHVNSTTKVRVRAVWDPIRLSGELLTRGWVIQERVLSPRTLFYGSSGIYWECVQTQRTEEGLDRFNKMPKTAFDKLLSSLESSPENDDVRYPTEQLAAFHRSWTELLQSYTSTQLTKQTDKLVAFQGIILHIAKIRRYTSAAGLWKELLPAELLWRTESPILKRTNIETAPSWSWASIDSPVTNCWTELVTSKETRDREYLCKVDWKVKVEDVQVVNQPNGRVINASLQIKGPLRRLPVGEEQSEGGLLNQEREWAAIRGKDQIFKEGGYGFYDGTITRSRVFPDYWSPSPTPQLFVLWVGRSTGTETRIRDGLIEPRFIDVGLVLEREGYENDY